MNLITSLAKKLNFDEVEVVHFLSTASRKYKVYKIPKRTKGLRVIAQPSKALKKYQRAFIDLYNFPAHSSSMAYQKGIGIKENALSHNVNPYILKMDFENFFNSIQPEMIWKTLSKTDCPTSDGDIKYLKRLLFWQPSKSRPDNLVLSIGAPSSPSLSNLCMYDFDDKLTELCKSQNISYTRYADDLTFSTQEKNILFSVPLEVKNTLSELFGKNIIINTDKTVFTSKAHNRHITGITINNEGLLSLGRKRKRYIKHLVHQFCMNQLLEDDVHHLQGLLSFSKHIEPTFIDTLKIKYTEEIIQQIIETRI